MMCLTTNTECFNGVLVTLVLTLFIQRSAQIELIRLHIFASITIPILVENLTIQLIYSRSFVILYVTCLCSNKYITEMLTMLLTFVTLIGDIPSNKLQIIAQKCVFWNKNL